MHRHMCCIRECMVIAGGRPHHDVASDHSWKTITVNAFLGATRISCFAERKRKYSSWLCTNCRTNKANNNNNNNNIHTNSHRAFDTILQCRMVLCTGLSAHATQNQRSPLHPNHGLHPLPFGSSRQSVRPTAWIAHLRMSRTFAKYPRFGRQSRSLAPLPYS